jgi:hypothetical protein
MWLFDSAVVTALFLIGDAMQEYAQKDKEKNQD